MAFRVNYSLGVDIEDHEEPCLEDKEMENKTATAAFLLLSLKHKPLSFEAARKLEVMKFKNQEERSSKNKRKGVRIHEPKAPPTKEAFYGMDAPFHVAPQQVLEEEQGDNLFYGNYAPPDIPPSLWHLISECSKPFEKQLTSSDIRADQARLAMSKEDVQNHIFPLLNEDDDPSRTIKVLTYDMDGKVYPMEFKLWVSKIYVLTRGRKTFCHEKELVETQDFVTVWAFRNIDKQLCFAISSRRLPVLHIIKKKRLRHN